MNLVLNLLKRNNISQYVKIMDMRNRLSNYNNYMKLFNTEFEKAKRESIIDFSVISLVIMERQDLNRFKEERKKCPNRIDKILYHLQALNLFLVF